jgi:predicted nuclease with TOPRIM domain
MSLDTVRERSKKEIEKVQKKISEGKDLSRDEATLALIDLSFPFIEEKWNSVSLEVSRLGESVKTLSTSVDSLNRNFSERGENLLQKVQSLATKFEE